MRQMIEVDSRVGSTEASVALPLAGALIVLAVGYLVIEWIWRKLWTAPRKTRQPGERVGILNGVGHE